LAKSDHSHAISTDVGLDNFALDNFALDNFPLAHLRCRVLPMFGILRQNAFALPVNVSLRDESEMKAIGIDIGGTKIAVASVENGAILSHCSFPTDAARGFDHAMSRINTAIDQRLVLSGWQPCDLSGIGIGCTGPVNPFHGTVHNPYTLPTWDDRNLIEAFASRYEVPVRLENDADAAAIGEYYHGAGQGADSMVMLTFGTGIGFAGILNNAIVRGVCGAHPEMGHIPIFSTGPACYCGIEGCFESIASGTAIDAAGRQLGFADSRAVFAAYAKGHADAKPIVERALSASKIATWTVLHSYLPKRIVLGGGMMEDHFDLFAASMKQAIDEAVLIPANQVEIVPATLGNEAGVIGAARLIHADLSLSK
jgi:glucokinase